MHKCTQRRITGMRSRGRRGIKIPHSSDFLTRLTPRPAHHPTLGRVHLVPMHERHLYLGIHIVAILGKCFACLTYILYLHYFPEYYETRNITLLYLFCTRLYSIPYSAASCFVELQAIITAISEIPALPAKPWNAQLFSGNL